MNWNPRYVAYAKAHGRDPVAMLTEDDRMWPGGNMCGFIIWIGERWREWDRLVGNKADHVRDEWEHGAFTRWLEGGAHGSKLQDVRGADRVGEHAEREKDAARR